MEAPLTVFRSASRSSASSAPIGMIRKKRDNITFLPEDEAPRRSRSRSRSTRRDSEKQKPSAKQQLLPRPKLMSKPKAQPKILPKPPNGPPPLEILAQRRKFAPLPPTPQLPPWPTSAKLLPKQPDQPPSFHDYDQQEGEEALSNGAWKNNKKKNNKKRQRGARQPPRDQGAEIGRGRVEERKIDHHHGPIVSHFLRPKEEEDEVEADDAVWPRSEEGFIEVSHFLQPKESEDVEDDRSEDDHGYFISHFPQPKEEEYEVEQDAGWPYNGQCNGEGCTTNAFVTLVFGSDLTYCVEAIVMGSSLRARTDQDMILLHTEEVSKEWLEAFRAVGWKTAPVPHLIYHECLYKGGRFDGVFTKLRATSLTSYGKVVLIDTDMVFLQGPDGVFEKEAPSAVHRHATGKYLDDEVIHGEDLFNRDRSQIGGINAGFVLLEPSQKDFHRMEFQLKTGVVPGPVPFRGGPEQDYLTRFYGCEWHSLGVQWNYQLHQLAYCSRPDHVESTRMAMTWEQVHVVHFSGTCSPAHWVLNAENHASPFKSFVEGQMLKRYLDILRQDKKGAKKDKPKVEAHLRRMTGQAAQSWKHELEKVLATFPWIGWLLEEARGSLEDEPSLLWAS